MTLLAEQNTHHLHLAMMKLMKLLTLALLCGAGVAINTLRAGVSVGTCPAGCVAGDTCPKGCVVKGCVAGPVDAVEATCQKEKDAFKVRTVRTVVEKERVGLFNKLVVAEIQKSMRCARTC